MPRFQLSQPVDAPRDVVWQALSDPRGLSAWQADEVVGVVAEGERLRMAWPGLGAELHVEVLELAPKHRVRFAWHDTEITFDLHDGGVSLTSSEIHDPEEYLGSGSAWALSLGTLAHYCLHHAGRTRQVVWLAKVATTTAAAAHVFFTDRHALGAWLGPSRSIGERGDEVHIELSDELSISGRVLTNTPGRDVLWSWREDGDSTLALRTLPHPTNSEERLILLSWSRWSISPANGAALSRLEAAHHRLIQLLDRPASA